MTTTPPPLPRPPKDKSVALILEILPGLFGFLGFGWIYANETQIGIFWLIGMICWDIVAAIIIVFTAGVGCFCTLPVNIALIALSATQLNRHIGQHPELFGVGWWGDYSEVEESERFWRERMRCVKE